MVGQPEWPTNASYNVLVRGDSNSAVVKVTPRWVRIGPGRAMFNHDVVTEECSSRGIWESEVESRIKDIAEKR
jgi:hypothetical protein